MSRRSRIATVVGLAAILWPATSPALVGESAEVLIPRVGVGQVELSPTGKWIAAVAKKGQLNGILAQRVGSREIKPVFATERDVYDLQWCGPDSLLATFGVDGRRKIQLVRFSLLGGRLSFSQSWIDAPGLLVDALELEDDELLWETEYDGKNTVYRMTLDELLAFGEKRDGRGRVRQPSSDVASIYGSSHRWIVDRSGLPRAAWRRDEEGYTLLFRAKGKRSFESAYSFLDDEEDRYLEPVALAADQKTLLVLAYRDRDTVGLHEFDPETSEFGATLFRRDDVDVSGVEIDGLSGEVVAVWFEADGQRQFHYFDSFRDRFARIFDERFPVDSIHVTSGALDGSAFVFRVTGPAEPGEYFYRNANDSVSISVAVAGAEIDRNRLSPLESFVVKSEDGTEIESYLTLPTRSDSPVPLVVMPHGGPVGVRDRPVYDFRVQYLASWGFAVLQPNYRGSSGYGRAFERSGKKAWARGIEDDIDAAVEHVIARPDIDGRRVCIIGGSYGGFSALASVIRHKDRYRCAISINGVTDIPFLAETSDYSDSRRALEVYSNTIGDPEKERDRLVEASPAYHADQIDAPVFMIHGTEDRRVDPDHAHRMLLMLETFGKDLDSLEIDGMQHAPSRLEWIIILRALRRNLTRHLMPGTEFVADPTLQTDEGREILPLLRFDN